MKHIIKERYEVLEKLGQGGFAEVYRGLQLQLDREVAIKFLIPRLAGEDFAARFQREARAVAKLNHHNIMQVHDFDQAEDGRYFMVMELLRGRDLDEHLLHMARKNERFTFEEATLITLQIAEALQYAHQNNVIHRDIKPANVFLTTDNRVVVADFGLARLAHEGGLTATGMIIGTPYYFAPEQGSGNPVDHRVDIYALGVVFYQLLVGDVPFRGETTMETLALHMNTSIPDPRDARPELPLMVTSLVMRAMAKNPDERYQDAGAMIGDLKVLLEDKPEATLIFTDIRTPTPTPSISGDEKIFTARTTIGQQPSTQKQYRLLGGVAALALIIIVAAAFILSQSGDDGGDKPLTVDFPPAEEGEYLIVVADIVGDEEAGVDVTRRTVSALKSGELAITLGEQLRVEQSTRAVGSVEEADALAEAGGAVLVVWGVQDAAGLEMIVQAHGYPDGTLTELRFTIASGDKFAAAVSDDLPLVVSIYAQTLMGQRWMFDGWITYILAGMLNFQNNVQQEDWNLVPSSALDQYILDGFAGFAEGDFEAADSSFSRAIALLPNDPGLYYLRWTINWLFLGRKERAEADLRRVHELMPDNVFPLFMEVIVDLIEGNHAELVAKTEGISFPKTEVGEAITSYRILGLVNSGDFERALEEIGQGSEISIAGLTLLTDPIAMMIHEIRADDESAVAERAALEGSRMSDVVGQTFSIFQNIEGGFGPSAMLLSYAAYMAEVDGNTMFATLTYTMGLEAEPGHFLLNWRLGMRAEAQSEFQKAYDFYITAAENAPVPFPIASYRAGVLVGENPDVLDEAENACELLGTAAEQANTSPEFYTHLVEKIEAARAEFGCE